jgi:putative heme-binding domain-containing protein
LTDDWPLDGVLGPRPLSDEVRSRVAREAATWLDQLSQLARSDPSGLVRLTLASTLQRLPVEMRPALATALMSHAADETDANLPWMVWYGLIPVADRDPVALADVVAAGAWSPTTRLIARRLTELIDRDPRGLNRLLTDAARASDCGTHRATSLDILTGMRDALMGWQRAPQPAAWDPFVRSLIQANDVQLQDLVRQLSALFGDGRALDDIQQVALDGQATIEARQAALQTLIDRRAPELRAICQQVLLAEPQLNVIAARGLAQFDDPAVASLLIAQYKDFREPQRPQIVSLLVARTTFAQPLLEAIAAGKIARSDVSAFQIRQLMSLGDTELASRAAEVWGALRESDAGKRQRIAELKSRLEHVTSDAMQLSQGRRLFQETCSKCHRLYGVGEQVGPDLTGSGRNNLDYLLENIVDPSAVVDAAHRMSIVTMVDGRVMNGLVTARTDRTITLRTETESLTIDREAIDEIHLTTLSPMPEGLLDNMAPIQIQQLIAYLRHPSQVPLADEN